MGSNETHIDGCVPSSRVSFEQPRTSALSPPLLSSLSHPSSGMHSRNSVDVHGLNSRSSVDVQGPPSPTRLSRISTPAACTQSPPEHSSSSDTLSSEDPSHLHATNGTHASRPPPDHSSSCDTLSSDDPTSHQHATNAPKHSSSCDTWNSDDTAPASPNPGNADDANEQQRKKHSSARGRRGVAQHQTGGLPVFNASVQCLVGMEFNAAPHGTQQGASSEQTSEAVHSGHKLRSRRRGRKSESRLQQVIRLLQEEEGSACGARIVEGESEESVLLGSSPTLDGEDWAVHQARRNGSLEASRVKGGEGVKPYKRYSLPGHQQLQAVAAKAQSNEAEMSPLGKEESFKFLVRVLLLFMSICLNKKLAVCLSLCAFIVKCTLSPCLQSHLQHTLTSAHLTYLHILAGCTHHHSSHTAPPSFLLILQRPFPSSVVRGCSTAAAARASSVGAVGAAAARRAAEAHRE